MIERLRARQEWKFFGVLPKADRTLTAAWWIVLVARGLLPVVFALAMGLLVEAVQRGDSLGGPLMLVGFVFVLLQVLTPIHQAISANLGDRTAAWLYDRLTEACVRPPGMGHLEDPKLAGDLALARDFDLGMTGPPLSFSMDFIAGGLVEMIAGLACAAVLSVYAWWAPLLLAGAWLATHWLLRESAVWRDRNTDEVRSAQRDSECLPPRGGTDFGQELRLFGLANWIINRFITRRTRLHELSARPPNCARNQCGGAFLLVVSANLIVFGSLANAAASGTRSRRGHRVCAVRGGRVLDCVRWAQLGAGRLGAPVAVLRLEPAMASAGALPSGNRLAKALPARAIRFRELGLRAPGGAPVLEIRPDDSRGLVAGHRGPERRRQDDARQAALPPL